MKNIILATRGSKLAMVQANMIKKLIEEQGYTVTIQTVSTKGDKDQVTPLSSVGGNGLFVREIEKSLLNGSTDIAVHSGKDLPYELEPGLEIAMTPEAADSRDVIVWNRAHDRAEEVVIGTSSSRRVEECRAIYPAATFQNIRGNVDTRLRKLKDGEYDGVVFAKAGLDRISATLDDFTVEVFEANEFLPAPCQGIIAVECRSDDTELKALLESISDEESFRRFQVERYMFSLLRADCSMGIGVHSAVNGEDLQLTVLFNQKKITKSGLYSDYQNICKEIKDQLNA